eukprot:scaffold173528_cov31-Tisochrysis_lutea.AAC.4
MARLASSRAAGHLRMRRCGSSHSWAPQSRARVGRASGCCELALGRSLAHRPSLALAADRSIARVYAASASSFSPAAKWLLPCAFASAAAGDAPTIIPISLSTAARPRSRSELPSFPLRPCSYTSRASLKRRSANSAKPTREKARAHPGLSSSAARPSASASTCRFM